MLSLKQNFKRKMKANTDRTVNKLQLTHIVKKRKKLDPTKSMQVICIVKRK